MDGRAPDYPDGYCGVRFGCRHPPTVNVNSWAGEVVVDVLASDGGPPTVGAGQTQQWNLGQDDLGGAGSSEPGAASVEMSWTAARFWALGAVPLKPAL